MKLGYVLLLASTFLVSAAVAHADTFGQDGIVRDEYGNLLIMSQAGAIKACADQGMRLPTIRELAKMSQAMGARGILETNEVKEGEVPAGFYLVSAIDPNGQKDTFYFNYFGYVRPAGDLGNNWFWSSSAVSGSSDGGYVLRGDVGDAGYDGRDYYVSAVLCVIGQ
jgi:hypothetical protein